MSINSRKESGLSFFPCWKNNRQVVDNNKFTVIEGWPIVIPVWTYNIDSKLEFLEDETQKALSGLQKPGISGFRATLSAQMRNTFPADTDAIKNLLDVMASQKKRTAYRNIPISNILNNELYIDQQAGGGFDIDTDSFPFTSTDTLTNAYIVNTTREENRLISRYFVSDRRIRLFEDVPSSWQTTDTYNIRLFINQPTYVGIGHPSLTNPGDISTVEGEESWESGVLICRLVSSVLSIQRELEIGNQVVSMNFESAERFDKNPSQAVLQY